MQRSLKVLAIFSLILVLAILAGCISSTETPSIYSDGLLLPMSDATDQSLICADCPQATLAALQNQEKNSTDAQAAATAAIMRANAQATLNAVSSTLSAAQTQEKNNANIIAAQVAATAEIARANAQATLVSAGATQSAAQTQDAIRQTQEKNNTNIIAAQAAATAEIARAEAQATLVSAGSTQSAALTQDAIREIQAQSIRQMTAEIATRSANEAIIRQNNAILAARTQTAVANHIATQTQSALATEEWYASQARQRANERWAQFSFIWMLCLPLTLLAIAFVVVLFFWRWMKIRETQQRIEMQAEAPMPTLIIEHEPRHNRRILDIQNQTPANPTDHVGRWLDEIKRKLLADKKDQDDHSDS